MACCRRPSVSRRSIQDAAWIWFTARLEPVDRGSASARRSVSEVATPLSFSKASRDSARGLAVGRDVARGRGSGMTMSAAAEGSVGVAATGVLTGWGAGIAALPRDAARAANGRPVIALPPPQIDGDRFRRATRECRLGAAAVEALLGDGGLTRAALLGSDTALIYVTATAYAGSNRAFIEQSPGPGALLFPYTAPSAVPAEVAIEFGLMGPYAIFIGAADTAMAALWQGALLLARRACERVVVLAVETVEECADLFARGRWLVRRPLVESAAADRKSTRLNSSHLGISYAVFCLN